VDNGVKQSETNHIH